MVERLALERLVAIRDLNAHALARRERDHLVGGKTPLGEDIEHLAAYVAGGAHDRDLKTHRNSPKMMAAGGIKPPARQLLGEKA